MTDNSTRGDSTQKPDYAKRLNRIEGPVRCIQRAHPGQRRHQSPQAVTIGLLGEHIRHCVHKAMADGYDDTIDIIVTEATKATERLVKA